MLSVDFIIEANTWKRCLRFWSNVAHKFEKMFTAKTRQRFPEILGNVVSELRGSRVAPQFWDNVSL